MMNVKFSIALSLVLLGFSGCNQSTTNNQPSVNVEIQKSLPAENNKVSLKSVQGAVVTSQSTVNTSSMNKCAPKAITATIIHINDHHSHLASENKSLKFNGKKTCNRSAPN